MKAEFINPILTSIVDVLGTMAQVEAKPSKPHLKESFISKGDVTGMIGLVGKQTRGSLAISFTEQSILYITEKMLGEKIDTIDDTVTDMVGEITNMVTGGAKRIFSEKGYDFDLAIPGVISGKDHEIRHKTNGKTIILPFQTENGSFFVEICFED